jgi:hypothetical protein
MRVDSKGKMQGQHGIQRQGLKGSTVLDSSSIKTLKNVEQTL